MLTVQASMLDLDAHPKKVECGPFRDGGKFLPIRHFSDGAQHLQFFPETSSLLPLCPQCKVTAQHYKKRQGFFLGLSMYWKNQNSPGE